MGKTFEVKMDTTRINGALSELARITGRDFKDVVRSEMQKILEKAVNNTPVATVALINQTKNPQLRARRLAARGLLKKVWVQVADKLAMALSGVPAYVGRAETSSGDYPEDAEVKETGVGSKFSIDGASYRIYDPRIIGAFASAMNGRANFFRTNLRRGVFDKAETIAKKYPGLTVNG
jgi:hypothetical protein